MNNGDTKTVYGKTLSNPNIEPDEDALQAVMVEAAQDAADRRKAAHAKLMESLGPNHIPKTSASKENISEFVAKLAKDNGVEYIRSPVDELADTITELCGDSVTLDDTENLLIALKRAKVIDGPTMSMLLSKHLEQKSDLKPAPSPSI